MENADLIKSLRIKCTARNLEFNDDVLSDEINDAIVAVNSRRRFIPTKEMKYDKKYESIIVKLALYSLTKVGAEGEVAHTENGIQRQYENGGDYADSLLNQIVPLVR